MDNSRPYKKAYFAMYRTANKERIKERNKVYKAANKERDKERIKAYRTANKEKTKEQLKEYYGKNRQKIVVKRRGKRNLRRSDKANVALTLLANALKDTK